MDRKRAELLADRVQADVGGALITALAYIGDRMSIFRRMRGAGWLSVGQISQGAQIKMRYAREWAKAMVAAEYLDYDPRTSRYRLSPEQAEVLAVEGGPFSLAGEFQFALPAILNVARLREAFRKGGGIPYEEMGGEIPEGIDRVSAAAYEQSLVKEWLPRVPGLVERLEKGIRVADIGCGGGRSSLAIAEGFPASRVFGIDSHFTSIYRARRLADAHKTRNVRFICATGERLRRYGKFGAVLALDCVHDMADPVATLRAIRRALEPGGVLVWSEVNASTNPLENRNTRGRLVAACSPFYCLTISLAHGGVGLGAVIGEEGVRSLARDAGFWDVERLAIDDPHMMFFALTKPERRRR